MSTGELDTLTRIFDMKVVEKPGIYLGADLDFSKRKGDLFARILSRFQKKLAGWKVSLLSFAGWVTLVKHALLGFRYICHLSLKCRPISFSKSTPWF